MGVSLSSAQVDKYSVKDDIDISVLSDLLNWEVSSIEFESFPSVDTTQTSSCIYTHDDEKLIVELVETRYIGFTSKDANMLNVATGSYNDLTGEITYEYTEAKGYFSIFMSYTTSKGYKGIKEKLNEIASMLELDQAISSTTSTLIFEN
jgi:hypothetical protein